MNLGKSYRMFPRSSHNFRIIFAASLIIDIKVSVSELLKRGLAYTLVSVLPLIDHVGQFLDRRILFCILVLVLAFVVEPQPDSVLKLKCWTVTI